MAVSMTTIARGFDSGVEEALQVAITTEAEWHAFWRRHASNTEPPRAPPAVDFSAEMVICVFMGTQSTGGYSIEIKSIEQGASGLRVVCETTSPRGGLTTQALTQPYHMVRAQNMLAAVTGGLIASSSYMAGVSRPAVQVRSAGPQMADISAFGDVWGFDAKKAIFDAWDPEKPRDYDNFNPFERNDEGSMADTNGCFPGQSRGYKPPNRPDQSWAIMQEEKVKMDALKTDPKFSISGKPGNFSPKWQKNLGAP